MSLNRLDLSGRGRGTGPVQNRGVTKVGSSGSCLESGTIERDSRVREESTLPIRSRVGPNTWNSA